ncbi:MAG TPA: T9SS type A sorting domain-containing protein [Bacteroidota bacterium]|nr:T9SS type A sorting domain-containing protein [Bacteroidota bacterium]
MLVRSGAFLRKNHSILSIPYVKIWRTLALVLALFVSRTAESQWVQMDTTLGYPVHCFTSSGPYIFAGTYRGIFRSGDDGQSWTSLNIGPPSSRVYEIISLAANGSQIAGGGFGYFFYSPDTGTTWRDSSVFIQPDEITRSIAFNGGTIYAGMTCLQDELCGPNGGAFISSDNGINWNSLNGLSGWDLAFDFEYSFQFVGNNTQGVFVSIDGSATWTPWNDGLTNTNVRAFTSTDSFMYAATWGGVFQMQKYIGVWKPVNNGLTDTLVETLTDAGNYLFAGTYHGSVYFSSNAGLQWQSSDTGLPLTLIRQLYVNDGYLYAGTDSGAWRRPLSDFYPTFSLQLTSSWNLVSVPAVFVGEENSLLTTRASQAFAYHAGPGYRALDTLRTGVGFWVKEDSAVTIQFHALPIQTDTIQVSKGWNLIGSISDTVDESSIVVSHTSMTLSNVYSYSGSYSQDTMIVPGRGYWLKASVSGTIVLGASQQSLQSRANIVRTNEMPPPPPSTPSATIPDVPKEFSLDQNYPNPFNPTTSIHYALPQSAHVRLTVYNVLGEVVLVLVNDNQSAGYKSASFDASALPSGAYLYRLESGSYAATKKMVVMK